MPKNYTEEELKNGRWVTVNGAKVFIQEGEDIQSAFNRALNKQPKRKEEKVKGLIFGTAHITDSFIDIDGYSNKKTEKGMLEQLAKAVEHYDKGEADAIRDMIKFNEMNQLPARRSEGAAQYIIEWEPVPGATRIKDDENEYKDANFYCHIRLVKG